MSCEDTLVCIHAHLSDQKRIDVCLEFVKQIKTFGYDVIVTSHTPATKEFQEEVDYFVYDKDNIILSDVNYLGYMTWYAPAYDVVSKEFCSYNTVLAVFRLMHLGTQYAKLLGKDKIHLFDYDGYLESPYQLLINEEKIDKGLDGVFYYWKNEDIVDDGRGTETVAKTKLQVTTRFISAKVDYLLKCFEKYKDIPQQKSTINDFGFLVGEEYYAYVFELTSYNDEKNTNIELKPFVDNLERMGMIQDRVHTHQDFSWVALILNECVHNAEGNLDCHYLFMMNPHKDTTFKVYINDSLFHTHFSYQKNYHMIQINSNSKIDIECDDSHFRSYDLKNPDEVQRIRVSNSLFFKK